MKKFILLLLILSLFNGCMIKRIFNNHGGKGHSGRGNGNSSLIHR